MNSYKVTKKGLKGTNKILTNNPGRSQIIIDMTINQRLNTDPST